MAACAMAGRDRSQAVDLLLFTRLKAQGQEAALKAAQEFIHLLPGNPVPTSLTHFQVVGSDYMITFVTNQNSQKYTVKVTGDKNAVSEITPQAPASGQ